MNAGIASPPESAGWLLKLFEQSPYGLVVTDRVGVIQDANARASMLLLSGETRSPLRGARCCDVICDPLDEHRGEADGHPCLVRRALSIGRALPETRFSVDLGGLGDSVWITASPIEGEETLVVVYLRPENRHYVDRRRRMTRGVKDQDPAPPELRIQTLGRTRVQVAGKDLGGDWLQQRPGQLLEYLLCARHGTATSDQISEALWPGAAQPWSNASVRHQVHVLREKLEPERDADRPSRFIVTRRGGYMLERERTWIDADEFEDEARTGLSLFVQGEGTSAMAPLERAHSLYQGDFLSEDPYADWALEERDRLRELAGRELRAMVSLKRSAGDLDAATEYARRLAEMEPFDLDVQREFLEMCIERGRRSEAMRRYALIRRRVRREFGHDPDFTLADLGV